MPTPKETPNDKRAAILRAGTAVLCKQGLHRLSFESVAAESGLSRQLVRYYFPTIDDLMIGLCDHFGAIYQGILTKTIVNAGAVDRLSLFLDFFFGVPGAPPMPDNLEAYDALVGYAVTSPKFSQTLCLQYRTLGEVMNHELQISHPALSRAARDELSYLFVSMMHAHWSYVASLGYTPDHGILTRKAFDRLIASYLDDASDTRTIARPWAQQSG